MCVCVNDGFLVVGDYTEVGEKKKKKSRISALADYTCILCCKQASTSVLLYNQKLPQSQSSKLSPRRQDLESVASLPQLQITKYRRQTTMTRGPRVIAYQTHTCHLIETGIHKL